jgi:hypothetical protein
MIPGLTRPCPPSSGAMGGAAMVGQGPGNAGKARTQQNQYYQYEAQSVPPQAPTPSPLTVGICRS